MTDSDASDSDGYYGDSDFSDSSDDDDDDNRSMILNVDSDSDGYYGNSDFSDSSDDDYDDKLRDLYSFWRLEMCKQLKKWRGAKLKKSCPISVLQHYTYI